jgi:hypothetical protein
MKKHLLKLSFFLLSSALFLFNNTARSQVLQEDFEGAGWVIGASAGGTTIAGATPTSGNTNTSWWYSAISVCSNTGAVTTLARTGKAVMVRGTSSSFIATPVLGGGVAQVTVWVMPTSATTQFNIGIATATNTTGSGQFTNSFSSAAASSGVTGIWTISNFSAGLNMVSGVWQQLTFTANVPASQFAMVKFQRVAAGSVCIDDIVITSPISAPSVTTGTASTTTTTATISGNNLTSIGSASVTVSGVAWSLTSGAETATSGTDFTTDGPTSVGAFASTISGLTSGTPYYAKAYATNSVGTAYGSEISFTTSVPTTNYYNVPGADISVITNWGTAIDGTGSNPADFITTGQAFNLINAGATISAPLTITGVGSKLIIGDGTHAISFTSAQAITATVDVLAQATFTNQSITNPVFGTISTASTINFDGASIVVPATNFGNLGLINGSTLPVGVVGIAGTFSPGITTTAVVGNTIVFNGSSAQTIPSFIFDSLAVLNAVSTAGSSSVIKVNKGLKVSAAMTVTATDSLCLAGSNAASLVIDASKILTDNGNIVLRSLTAPLLNGTLNVNSGAKYIVDVNVGNLNGIIPAATYAVGSDVVVLQGAPRIPATIGGNLTWNSIGSGTFVNNASNTISGNFTVNAGQINNGSGGTARTVTVGGNLYMTGGRYDVLGSPGSAGTGQSLIVNGDVNISGGKLFASAGTTGSGVGSITIKGNLLHTSGVLGDSNIVNTSGVIIFAGSSNQNISTIGISDTTSITINNPAGVTLLTNLDSIVGTLNLTAGSINTGVLSVIVRGAGTVSRTAGYVNGNLQKYIPASAGAVSKTFEVGDAAVYAPVSVDFASVTTGADLVVKTTTGDHPQIATSTVDPALSVNRYWTISNSGVVFTTYDATFNFVAGDVDALADPATFIIGDYHGGSWSYPTVGTLTPTSSKLTGNTGFSDFILGQLLVPLPVKLEYINGQKLAIGNALNWKVNCTSNSMTMKIERSANGVTFDELSSITADRVRCEQPFSYSDALPLTGINYYRVKMIDIDGKISYSPIVAVINSARGFKVVGVYPTLVRNETSVSISTAKTAMIETVMTDMQGRIISKTKQNISAGSSLVKVDCTLLSKGMYNIAILADGAIQGSVKIVKY